MNKLEDKEMNLKIEVKEYMDYCKFRKRLNEKTLKAYHIDLMQYIKFLGGEEQNKSIIERYITQLHQKYKQKTVKRKIASIKAFYNYLEEEEIIQESPMRKIKVKFKETTMLPRIVPKKEIEQLLNHMYSCNMCGNDTKSRNLLRDIAVVEVLFATGARVYEIANIGSDCIDLHSGLVRILGKGGKERYIQIANTVVLKILKQYYIKNENVIKKSGFFFTNQRGKRFSEQSIRIMLKKYTKQAGIERNITPHMFRHSFATYLIEAGVDISYIQQILGHSSIKTTQIYIHIALGRQIEILKTLHPRNQMKIQSVA